MRTRTKMLIAVGAITAAGAAVIGLRYAAMQISDATIMGACTQQRDVADKIEDLVALVGAKGWPTEYYRAQKPGALDSPCIAIPYGNCEVTFCKTQKGFRVVAYAGPKQNWEFGCLEPRVQNVTPEDMLRIILGRVLKKA